MCESEREDTKISRWCGFKSHTAMGRPERSKNNEARCRKHVISVIIWFRVGWEFYDYCCGDSNSFTPVCGCYQLSLPEGGGFQSRISGPISYRTQNERRKNEKCVRSNTLSHSKSCIKSTANAQNFSCGGFHCIIGLFETGTGGQWWMSIALKSFRESGLQSPYMSLSEAF